MIGSFETDKFVARIDCSDAPDADGWLHASVVVLGGLDADCLAGAQWAADFLAKGRITVFRVRPEASHETNFDTKMIKHRGYVRFSFKLEPGEWLDCEPRPEGTFVGFAHG